MLMKMKIILSLLTIFLFKVVKIQGSSCIFRNNSKTLECSLIKSFREIFNSSSRLSDISELIISSSEIKIPNFAFNTAKNLEKLTIEKSFIKRISSNSFEKAHSIKNIVMKNNQINSFDQLMFEPLANSLIELTLTENKLNDEILKLLKSIEDLEFLTFLDLSSNQITAQLLSIIKLPQSLKTLILNNNLITSDGLKQLNYFNFLNELYLNGNQINELGRQDFNNLNKLNTLTLSQNNIQIIPSQVFYNLENLKILELQQQINGISFIDNYAFSIIEPHLGYEIIDLSGNNIKQFAQECIFCSQNPEKQIYVNKLNIQNNSFNNFNPSALLKLSNINRFGEKPNLILNQIPCDCNLNQLKSIFFTIGDCLFHTTSMNVSTYLFNFCAKNELLIDKMSHNSTRTTSLLTTIVDITTSLPYKSTPPYTYVDHYNTKD